MNQLLLGLLFLICIGLIFWGFKRKNGIYQYPFLAGSTFFVYIFPQAFAITQYPGDIPNIAIQRTLFMCCLCLVMCFLGYKIKIPSAWSLKKEQIYDSNRLNIAAYIYIVIGIIFIFTAGFIDSEFASGGAETGYRAGRTGIVTIILFFSRLFYIGFSILYIKILDNNNRKSSLQILVFVVSLLLILSIIVTGGRREPSIFLGLSSILAFYFTRNKIISKWIIIFGIIVSMLAVNPYTVSQYRIATELRGDWTKFREVNYIDFLNKMTEINYVDNLNQFLNTQGNLEIRNAALYIDKVVKNQKYQWGVGYWNSLVFGWVPAQFVGKDFKSSLEIELGTDLGDFCNTVSYSYDYSCRSGQTFTGIADAFVQFDYFGCLIFGIISFFFKVLWQQALYQKSLFAKVAYINLIVRGMLAITHNTLDFPSRVLYFFLFSSPIWLYSSLSKTEQRKLQKQNNYLICIQKKS